MNIKAICMGAALALSAGGIAHAGALDVDEGITGPRVTALIDQIQGVDKGIIDAGQLNKIEPAEAHSLHMRAAHISQAAERTAAAGHGTISATQYQQLLHQIDDVSQRLRVDTGSAFLMGNGGDGGYYPNGYGPNG